MGADIISTTQPNPLSSIACGELQGSATALQMPNVACKYVRFKALLTNAGNVYIGGAGVTKPNGTTDVTTGLEMLAFEEICHDIKAIQDNDGSKNESH